MKDLKLVVIVVFLSLMALPAHANPAADAAAGVAAARAGDYAESIGHFTRAIDAPGTSAQWLAVVYNNRGFAYDELGRHEAALADYAMAMELDPTFAPPFNNRGYILQKQGDLQAAIKDYTRAIALEPNYAPAYRNRGHIFRKAGRHREAIEDFTAVIRLQPDDAGAYVARALSNAAGGAIDQAIADAEAAYRLRPDNPTVVALRERLAEFQSVHANTAATAD